MADQTEDISSFEDIGQRLDDLLDALEVSAQEVAQTSANLGKSLDEIAAAEVASDANAVIGDGGVVVNAKKPEPTASSEPAPATAADSAAASERVADPDSQAEPESEPTLESEPEPQAEPVDQVGGETTDAPSVEPEAEAPPEPATEQPEAGDAQVAEDAAEPPADSEDAAAEQDEPEPADPAKPAPTLEYDESFDEPTSEDESSIIDDGLLIEPESKANAENVDDAPVGPADLENELDEELDALLASRMFEDPLAEVGTDESATPIDLPEAEPDVEASAEASKEEERKPNLPTDEAELIGELDEQLAALADAELDSDEEAEPALATPAASVDLPQTTEESDQPVEAAAAAPEAEPAAQPEPVAVAAKPMPAAGWKASLARMVEQGRPVAERSWQRTQAAMIVGATRANAPLKDKPRLKQVVGWVALVHVFYAACLWSYVVLCHNPPAPQPATPQPTLEAPAAP